MREKIKKILIGYLPGFITGLIICGCVSVLAATYFPSNDVTYNNSNSGLQSTNVQDAINELYGVCFPPEYGSDTITNLVDTNSDELYKDDHGDIRYYGASPNNYVRFNNELWRIIGVIDGKIKIIRNESIGEMAWSSNGKNNWDNSDLKSYLNKEYYNGIDETYRKMISEEKYYLGGINYSNYNTLTASGYYNTERSNSVYGSNPTSTEQYIGLMYPSDYGYASGSSCLSTALFNYDKGCENINYLFNGVYEWLQSPLDYSDSYGTQIVTTGHVYIDSFTVTYHAVIRPTLYLTSETQITSGDGSQSNPFQISL